MRQPTAQKTALAPPSDAAEHQASLQRIDGANAPVFALRRVYPLGYRSPRHSHRKAQLWGARRGVVMVSTADGRFMVPPGHGLLIPAGLDHASEALSEVEMLSIYVSPLYGGADRPRVVEITPLARSLMQDLVAEEGRPTDANRQQLVMNLLLDEITRLPHRPLGLPIPQHEGLARLCRRFLKAPSAVESIDDWAAALTMSRRSFTRLFRAEIGISFVTWRQQACLFASLPKLASGESVTSVALDAGYENIAAYTTMFRRMLGSPPSTYFRERFQSAVLDASAARKP